MHNLEHALGEVAGLPHVSLQPSAGSHGELLGVLLTVTGRRTGQRHTVMAVAAPEILDRLVMMTATTKTFNIAGCHVGNVIIPDAALRGPPERRPPAAPRG